MPRAAAGREIPQAVIILVAVCVVLSAVMATALAVLAGQFIAYQRTTSQHHAAFCAYLATELAIQEAHQALEPMVPAGVGVYQAEGCPSPPAHGR